MQYHLSLESRWFLEDREYMPYRARIRTELMATEIINSTSVIPLFMQTPRISMGSRGKFNDDKPMASSDFAEL
jgi:hypothetical protein